MTDVTGLEPGLRIGNYLLECPVGRGAFASVWRAVHHERRQRVVAVKIALDPAYRRQLATEGLLPDVDDPRVVPILDSDTRFSERPYVVMPYYERGSLAQRIAAAPGGLPEDEVERLLTDILGGLSAAHARGIVHRDIKPSNILLTDDGGAVMADFGLSLCAEGATLLGSLIQSMSIDDSRRTLAGTLAYLAPEIVDGSPPSPATDVFSVGVVLFEMLTGRRPCGPERPLEVRADLVADIGWDELYARACRPRDARFSDAAAMLARFKEMTAEAAPAAARTSSSSAPARPSVVAFAQPAQEETGTIAPLSRGDVACTCCAFSPDDALVLVGATDGVVRVWRTDTGDEVRRIAAHKLGIRAVAFAPDGAAFASASVDQSIRLWRTDTGRQFKLLAGHEAAVSCIAFRLDDAQLVSGSVDNTARVWDLSAGRAVQVFRRHRSGITSLAVSRSGKYAVTAGFDKVARLWDMATAIQVRKFSGHRDLINAVALTPSARFLITGGDDARVVIHDASTGKVLRTLDEHRGWVSCLAVTVDGRYVVSASEDRTARLWDIVTGNEVNRFEGHAGSVWTVAHALKHPWVLTGGADGAARLWDAESGRELHTLLLKP